MPTSVIPPPWREILFGWLLALIAGLIGRLMHHTVQVQRGRRRFWSMRLVWEIPVAVGTGFIGKGLTEYLGLHGDAAMGLIVAVSYLGPGFVETVVWRLIDRCAPANGEGQT